MKKSFVLIAAIACLIIACLSLWAGLNDRASARPPQKETSGAKTANLPEKAETPKPENSVKLADTRTQAAAPGDVVEIREKMFIAQCNDIYLNPNEYIGKTVRIEGIYDEYTDEDGTVDMAVIRNGPGCCGNDGVAGFAFSCDETPGCKQNDWISVEGIITPFTSGGDEIVIIGKARVTVKAERGAEYVTQ